MLVKTLDPMKNDAAQHPTTPQRLLLLDTCGAESSLALAIDGIIASELTLPARSASADLLQAITKLLERAGIGKHQLTAIGVVSGPGSFTGVRVGLAAAKGLCEGFNIPLAAVSRLAVLASAAAEDLAAFDAGRGELYLRDRDGEERLISIAELLQLATTRSIAVTEPKLAELLAAELDCRNHPPAINQPVNGGEGVPTVPVSPTLHTLHASDALPLVQACLAAGGSNVADIDANYVRGEAQIYARQPRSSAAGVA
jgi:tRNA threonylcarbamoyladenosine biosynthesis protein TsaB